MAGSQTKGKTMLKVANITVDQITDKTQFIRSDKTGHIITFTEDEWENAKAYYNSQVPNHRGAVPYAGAFKMWVGANRPVVNDDDLRQERLAVEQIANLKLKDIPEELYATYVDQWNNEGNWEPTLYLPSGVGAKFIAYVNDADGLPSTEEDTVYIERELIDSWREGKKMGRGPTPLKAYHEVATDDLEGLTAHTLVTQTGRVYKFDGTGKSVGTSKVLKDENEELKHKAAVQEQIIAQILANPEMAAEILAKSNAAA